MNAYNDIEQLFADLAAAKPSIDGVNEWNVNIPLEADLTLEDDRVVKAGTQLLDFAIDLRDESESLRQGWYMLLVSRLRRPTDERNGRGGGHSEDYIIKKKPEITARFMSVIDGNIEDARRLITPANVTDPYPFDDLTNTCGVSCGMRLSRFVEPEIIASLINKSSGMKDREEWGRIFKESGPVILHIADMLDENAKMRKQARNLEGHDRDGPGSSLGSQFS